MTDRTPIVIMGAAAVAASADPELADRYRCASCGRAVRMGEVATVDDAAPHAIKHIWCAPYFDYEPLPRARSCGYIGCPYPAARHRLCRDHHILMCALDADEPIPESEAPHGWRPNRCRTEASQS
jgi:hypothetical protein